ncbi:MAG: hypothetical protein KAJ19_17960, partial [Gammaproteobacteria bacterium]|nr:hypothetical protein [Gammaproteobacteria bacterium]
IRQVFGLILLICGIMGFGNLAITIISNKSLFHQPFSGYFNIMRTILLIPLVGCMATSLTIKVTMLTKKRYLRLNYTCLILVAITFVVSMLIPVAEKPLTFNEWIFLSCAVIALIGDFIDTVILFSNKKS